MQPFRGLRVLVVVSAGALVAAPVALRAGQPDPVPITTGRSSPPAPGSGAEPGSADSNQTLYALGVLISRNLDEFGLSTAEFDRVKAGLIAGFAHRAQIDLAADTPKIQALRRERMAQRAVQRQRDGQSYLARAAATSGARKTASGLVMVPIQAGTGPSPAPRDSVAVKYAGRLIDGSVFDTAQGQPAIFSLSGVIPCWSEALQLMKVGERDRVVCPPQLAYGERGQLPKIAPQSTLDFDVELVGITAGSP